MYVKIEVIVLYMQSKRYFH